MLERGPEQVKALLDELLTERGAFAEALAKVDPQLLTTPGLVGDWSVRELLAHLGYWAGHAAEAIHRAEQGRTQDFGEDELEVDERNAVVARVAAETDLATVRQREQAAFDALATRLGRMDPAWLDERVAYGDTLEHVIRDDGADHYREHTLDLRSWFGEGDVNDEGGDEADGETEDGA
ncbi:MAG: maleylpyruvate isomerase N-terminal domain-containing protein [Candidatus Limnocylindria bacterium]